MDRAARRYRRFCSSVTCCGFTTGGLTLGSASIVMVASIGMFPLRNQTVSPQYGPAYECTYPTPKPLLTLAWNPSDGHTHIIEAKKHSAPKLDGANHQSCRSCLDLPAKRNPKTEAKIQVILKHHFLYHISSQSPLKKEHSRRGYQLADPR